MRGLDYRGAELDSEKSEGDEEEGYECNVLDSVDSEKVSSLVDQTTQGAAMLSVAQWSDEEYGAKHGQKQATGRLFNGLGLFAISAILQTILVMLVLFFSDERMQDPYQFESTTAMAGALREARRLNETLVDTDPVLKLCLKDHSVPYSQSIVVFLWLCKMSPEVGATFWSLYILASLPRSSGSALEFSDGVTHIVRLPSIAKWMLVIFVKLPTLCIQLALTITGLTFLMYCSALGTLILKAMALTYVGTVPNIVYAGLASKALITEVGKTKLTGTVMKSTVWDAWVSGSAKILVHIALAFWYCRVLHAGLTSFRWECFFYKYQFVFPYCHCGAELFGVHIAN